MVLFCHVAGHIPRKATGGATLAGATNVDNFSMVDFLPPSRDHGLLDVFSPEKDMQVLFTVFTSLGNLDVALD